MKYELYSTKEWMVPAVLRIEVSAKLLFISLLYLNRQHCIDYSKFPVWTLDKQTNSRCEHIQVLCNFMAVSLNFLGT